MKVIFLDIDGVLNNTFSHKHKTPKDSLCRRSIEVLNEIIRQSGAQVVVSSTWRLYYKMAELQKFLEDNGFSGQIIGDTPDLSYAAGGLWRTAPGRGWEIHEWIQKQEKQGNIIEKFVILDDDDDMKPWEDHLVLTQWEGTETTGGLEEKHIPKIMEFLT